MGDAADAEIPDDAANSGCGMTKGEYVVTRADAIQRNQNSVEGVDASSHAAAIPTCASQYTPAAPMITTVPYCAPLLADPYIVEHEGLPYTYQVSYHSLISI